jgi:hypothetical protein
MKSKSKNSEASSERRAAAGPGEQSPHPGRTPSEAPHDRIRHWLLGGFMAICVGRPLVPSEGVSWLGDGHSFTLFLLVLTAVYFVTVIQRRALQRPLQLVDVAMALLVLICVASSMLGLAATWWAVADSLEFSGRKSSPRLAVNMTWEWIGLGLVFFLARQLIVTPLEKRGVVAIMIALAVVVSAFGMYQVGVTLPAERAAYAENPEETLRQIGQWFPLGSPERDRFEARLASPEPLATFALTNSLAGFLAPWLVVALGVTWNVFENRKLVTKNAATIARYLGLAAALALMLVCLILTRSRSAYLALAVGLLVLPLVTHTRRRTLPWKRLAAAGIVLLLLLGALAAFGGGERSLLSEAGKSLDYRFQYWEATLDMISTFPAFGVGPGEFQNYYTIFKLPQASEEIRDPHNFLLEVWATGGTLAFMALVALLASFALIVWELKQPDENQPAVAPGQSSDDRWLLLLGGAAGFPLAYLAGLPFGFSLSMEQLVAGPVLGGLIVAVLWPWILRGELSLRLPAVGVLVLAIHWLAAGGVAYPGVAGTFWLLIALTMNQRSAAPAPLDQVSSPWWRLAPAMALGVSIAALIAHYYSAFLPVLVCRAEMARASNERLNDEVRFESMLRAMGADPLSPDPWMAAAQLSAVRLAENPGNGMWQQRLITSSRSVNSLQPHSSASARELGHLFREVYVTNPDEKLAELIVAYTRTAAAYYPNSAVVQGEYALSLEMAGKPKTAWRVAARALELDELTPHADKKMSTESRKLLEQLVASQEDTTQVEDNTKPAVTTQPADVTKENGTELPQPGAAKTSEAATGDGPRQP